MKHFVFTYQRGTGRLEVAEFATAREAFSERLRTERYVPDGTEVVVFHADSLDDIRRTHGRYFRTSSELAEDLLAAV